MAQARVAQPYCRHLEAEEIALGPLRIGTVPLQSVVHVATTSINNCTWIMLVRSSSSLYPSVWNPSPAVRHDNRPCLPSQAPPDGADPLTPPKDSSESYLNVHFTAFIICFPAFSMRFSSPFTVGRIQPGISRARQGLSGDTNIGYTVILRFSGEPNQDTYHLIINPNTISIFLVRFQFPSPCKTRMTD